MILVFNAPSGEIAIVIPPLALALGYLTARAVVEEAKEAQDE